MIIIITVSCLVLVGVSYIMLDILSGMVVTPKTPVKEENTEARLVVSIEASEIVSMQVSGDGRFIAYEERGVVDGTVVLNVVASGEGRPSLFSQVVAGDSLSWLGETASLVYEDGGDIFILDTEEGIATNLTSSETVDADPIPSPDGRYILWTSIPGSGGEDEAELWVMDADGSNQDFLAEYQNLPTWDPAGGRIASRQDTAISTMEGSYRHMIQTAVPGREGWTYYGETDGDVRFIWWPLQDELLYISPQSSNGDEAIRGVWYRVETPEGLKRVASTDGLGYEEAYYRFYPARGEERVAYVGEKGLEVMDYGERVIHRYAAIRAETPLAWDESSNVIYFASPQGIYRLELEG